MIPVPWPVFAGALAGAVTGTGALLCLDHLVRRLRPPLGDRLAPYLGPAPGASRSVPRTAVTAPTRYWAVVVAGALAGVLVAVVAGGGPGAWAVTATVGAGGGHLLLTHRRGHRDRNRRERIRAELPTVADLLALAVAAGEGLVPALERVCRVGDGALPTELRLALVTARSGTPLPVALESCARRAGSPELTRFVDVVCTAIDLGTPLAGVLRAQSRDVREAELRRLVEEGGRREILMLVPVVFLILPVTVLFVLFPGLAVLDLGP